MNKKEILEVLNEYENKNGKAVNYREELNKLLEILKGDFEGIYIYGKFLPRGIKWDNFITKRMVENLEYIDAFISHIKQEK